MIFYWGEMIMRTQYEDFLLAVRDLALMSKSRNRAQLHLFYKDVTTKFDDLYVVSRKSKSKAYLHNLKSAHALLGKVIRAMDKVIFKPASEEIKSSFNDIYENTNSLINS